jgi:hypothetical protein
MEPRKYEIERYVEEWHWDEKSHAFACEAGAFLYNFMDYLDESDLTSATIKKHVNFTWCIGYLTCHYGQYETFSSEIFADPPFYITEFRQDVDDAPQASRSYERTCNKLAKYIRGQKWETLPEYEFELSENIEDFYIGLKLLEKKLPRGKKKGTAGFQEPINTLRKNFVAYLREVKSRDEFIERMECCCQTMQALAQQLESIDTSGDYFETKIRNSLLEDVEEIQNYFVFALMNV